MQFVKDHLVKVCSLMHEFCVEIKPTWVNTEQNKSYIITLQYKLEVGANPHTEKKIMVYCFVKRLLQENFRNA